MNNSTTVTSESETGICNELSQWQPAIYSQVIRMRRVNIDKVFTEEFSEKAIADRDQMKSLGTGKLKVSVRKATMDRS